MHPVLFEIFGYPIRMYGIAMATAFIVNITLAYRRAPVEKQDQEVLMNTCLWIIIGTLVGGRLLFAYTQWEEFVSSPIKLISFWEGGLVFYGGFIGSYLCAVTYLIWANLNKEEHKRYIIYLLVTTFVFGYILSGIRILKGKALGEGIGHYLAFWNYGIHHSIGFLIAMVLVFAWFTWKKRKEDKPYRIMPILDLLSPYVGLGLSIHRTFGCFLNGCCYGRPTDVPWGVQFPLDHSGTRYYGVEAHLHPTQLYESINGLLIFFILIWFRKHRKGEGEVTGWLLMIYAIDRYLIEFLRGDKLRGEFGETWAPSHIILLFLLVWGALFLMVKIFRSRGIAKGIVEPDKPARIYGFLAALAGLTFVELFVGELLRLNPTLAEIGPISTSQFIGYMTFVIGFTIFAYARYLGRRAIKVPY